MVYSTGYYVPPPIDQCLKFKNHCKLLSTAAAFCILHDVIENTNGKPSQNSALTLIRMTKDEKGLFQRLIALKCLKCQKIQKNIYS
jgi:hypothetical protein